MSITSHSQMEKKDFFVLRLLMSLKKQMFYDCFFCFFCPGIQSSGRFDGLLWKSCQRRPFSDAGAFLWEPISREETILCNIIIPPTHPPNITNIPFFFFQPPFLQFQNLPGNYLFLRNNPHLNILTAIKISWKWVQSLFHADTAATPCAHIWAYTLTQL